MQRSVFFLAFVNTIAIQEFKSCKKLKVVRTPFNCFLVIKRCLKTVGIYKHDFKNHIITYTKPQQSKNKVKRKTKKPIICKRFVKDLFFFELYFFC